MEWFFILFVLFGIGSYLRLSFRQRDGHTDYPDYKRDKPKFNEMLERLRKEQGLPEFKPKQKPFSQFEQRLKQTELDESIPETIWPLHDCTNNPLVYSSQFMSAQEKQAHLRSDYWRNLKQERLTLANHQCEVPGCCSTNRLVLHHVTYESLGRERLNDVRAICQHHHQQIHDRLGYLRETYYPIEILS